MNEPETGHTGNVSGSPDATRFDTVMQEVGLERSGTVAHFDDAAGLGEIVDEHGVRINFHCTQIADGSRTIASAAEVTFVLRRSNLGRMEATAIRPRA